RLSGVPAALVALRRVRLRRRPLRDLDRDAEVPVRPTPPARITGGDQRRLVPVGSRRGCHGDGGGGGDRPLSRGRGALLVGGCGRGLLGAHGVVPRVPGRALGLRRGRRRSPRDDLCPRHRGRGPRGPRGRATTAGPGEPLASVVSVPLEPYGSRTRDRQRLAARPY